MSSLKYRGDIDGLRAVAVLSVLFFHFGLTEIKGIPIATGGYVGVDIFFVISGFLISKIIFDEITTGNYSITKFYARRIKRIFPALFVTYFFAYVFSIMLFTPFQANETSKTILSSLFFISNLYFSNKDSYFDNETHENPLLHTWSLSVEEQFYIVFPIIIFFIKNLSKKWKISIIFFFTIFSLVVSEFLLKHNVNQSFYTIQSRAWELSIGGILAIWEPRVIKNYILRNLIAILGLTSIIVTFVSYDKNTLFPALAALPVCLGTLLIIYTGSDERSTIISKILSIRPFRFIGLISYSLYLIHWPIITFLNNNIYGFNLSQFGKLGSAATAVIVIIIAYLSWKYIESPVRKFNGENRKNITVLIYGAVSTLILSLFGLALPAIYNALWKPTKQIILIDSAGRDKHFKEMSVGKCFLTSKYDSIKFYDRDYCLNISHRMQNTLLFGDSHSAQLISSLKQKFPNINFLQASASGCKPSLNLEGEKRCVHLMQLTYDEMKKSPPDSVIIAARWTSKNDVSEVYDLTNDLLKYVNKIYVIGPNIEYKKPLPKLLVQSMMTGNHSQIKANINEDVQDIDNAFKLIHFQNNVEYISFIDVVCNSDVNSCPTIIGDSSPLLFDKDHLTPESAKLFLDKQSVLFK